jgi:hypothetical protein
MIKEETKDNNIYEDVLIRLKREYGKDELVASLLKDIKELKIEHGKSQSYIDELKFDKEQLQKTITA